MTATDYIFGKRQNNTGITLVPEIRQSNLLYWIEAHALQSYPGSGNEWTDIASGKVGVMPVSNNVWEYDNLEKSIYVKTNGFYVNLNDEEVFIGSGQDVGFGCFLKHTDNYGLVGSPGFWRSGSLQQAGSGYINQYHLTTGKPKIRWNGTDIANGGVTPTAPFNEWFYIFFMVTSAGFWKLYYNGIEVYSINHTRSTGQFGIQYMLRQFHNNECITGKIKSFHIYNSLLTSAEILENNNQLRSFYGL